jgi:hypothetical protein
MKKSSRDRRAFRRAIPTLLTHPEKYKELQAAIQRINDTMTMIDLSQAQKAFADFKSTCDNLSKVKINISI